MKKLSQSLIISAIILVGEPLGHGLAYYFYYEASSPTLVRMWARNIVMKEID